MKYDLESKSKSGFGLSLSKIEGSIHPQVYWQDNDSKGGWHIFKNIDIHLKRWNLFVVSFRNNKFLGLHNSQLLNDKEMLSLNLDNENQHKIETITLDKVNFHPITNNLGGYNLESVGLPNSSAPLVIGSPFNSSFRGKIGPFGFYSSENLTKDLNKIVKTISKNPGGTIDNEKFNLIPIMQTTDIKTDISQNNLTIFKEKLGSVPRVGRDEEVK